MSIMVKPDLVSEHRETSRLLVVEVKQSIAEKDQAFFMQQLRSYAKSLGSPKTVYFVLVDNDWIRVFEEGDPEPRLLSKLPTKTTLKPYVGVEHTGAMSELLMAGMTMSWLRDLAMHWKEQDPPGSSEIKPDIVDLLTKSGVHVESMP
jgi:hypothetical protein